MINDYTEKTGGGKAESQKTACCILKKAGWILPSNTNTVHINDGLIQQHTTGSEVLQSCWTKEEKAEKT